MRSKSSEISRDKIRGILLDLINKNTVSYPHRNWTSSYSGITRFAFNNFSFLLSTALGVTNPTIKGLSVHLSTDKEKIADFFKNGLLEEIAALGTQNAKKIYQVLLSLPYVDSILKGYGIDELAATRAAVLLCNQPQFAKLISDDLVHILENKDPNNVSTLVTKLINTCIDLGSSGEQENTIAAKFVHGFIDKLCEQKLPSNSQETAKVDEQLNVEPFGTDRRKVLQAKRSELTSKYSILELLRYNFRFYIDIIKDANQLEFMKGLVNPEQNNQRLLKDLNKSFISVALSPDGDPEGLAKLKCFVMDAINLGINIPSRDACAKIMNSTLLKKVFDLPNTKALRQYKGLVIKLSNDEDNFQEVVKRLLVYRKEFSDATSQLLDSTYEEKDTQIKFQSLKRSILQYVDLLGRSEVAEAVKPLISKELLVEIFKLPALEGIQEYKDLVVSLAEENNIAKLQGFVEVVLQNREHLSKLMGEVLEYGQIPFNTTAKEKAFDKMLQLAIDLALDPRVIEKAIPLLNEKLIDDLFSVIRKNEASIDKKSGNEDKSSAIIDSVVITANSVIKDKRVEAHIPAEQKMFIGPILNDMAEQAQKRTKIEEIGSKFLADIFRKVPFDTVIREVQTNRDNIVNLTKHALTKLKPEHKNIIEKFEIRAEELIDLVDIFKNQNAVKSMADCIESPSATNIATLLITEPKLIGVACVKLFNYCKNNISQYMTKMTKMDEVYIKGVQERVDELGAVAISPSSKEASQVDIMGMQGKVSKLGGERIMIPRYRVRSPGIRSKRKELSLRRD